ncbi:MAG: hypothetical protein HS104_24115 [Polyangiaceae bacterium]|nr:hypothetical protein [Polyangiaceae bacterium]MCL4751872.1 hypothetical protein [Myxococcales bacterium]
MFDAARHGTARRGTAQLACHWALLGAAVFGSVACGPGHSDVEAVRSESAKLTTAVSSCPNGALADEHIYFRYIDTTVTSQICRPTGSEPPTIIATEDATAKQVDIANLLDADSAAFHSWHSGIQPAFRALLETDASMDRDVYIWFYVDQSDLPAKEWLAGEKDAGAAAAAVAESRIRSAAINLAGKLETAGVHVTTDVLLPVEAAAPQVAGMAATMQELNPSLKYWPEAMVPIIMAGADEDTDNTLLSLEDGVDDRDGAGLVNAYRSTDVATAKLDGGNSPSFYGHDYGTIYASSTPEWAFYSEQYKARALNGWQLRVAAFFQTRPTCPASPGSWSCTANPYPLFWLLVYDGSTLVGWSFNGNNNYKYTAFTNTSGVQRDYTIKLYVVAWNGLPATTFGVAWSASP